MDIEPMVIRFLRDRVGVSVSTEVPAERPDEFVTIDLAGGALDSLVLDRPMLAVMSWATSRADAKMLAKAVDAVMLDELPLADGIQRVRRESLEWWATNEKEPRYQGVYSLVVDSRQFQ